MKNTYLFILAAFLLVSACKKDEDQEPAECPANNTFVKEISQYVGGSSWVESTQEAIDGSIHVETVDIGGEWRVVQFSSDGTYVRTTNLGYYTENQILTVKDAYYLSTHSKISTYIADNTEYQGWVQIGYTYFNNLGTCASTIGYSTFRKEELVSLPTTNIKKMSFDGEELWTASLTGTYSGYLGVGPLIFDNNDVYAVTVDYKGPQVKVRIGGVDYEYSDTTRPPFYQTDTILIKDNIHDLVITKLSKDDGSIIYDRRQQMDRYYPSSQKTVNAIIAGNNLWVGTPNVVYSFDLNGNFIDRKYPVYNECYDNHIIQYIKSTSAGSVIVRGYLQSQNRGYLAKVDGNANIVWDQNSEGEIAFERFITTPNNGYIYNGQIFDANGVEISSYSLHNILTQSGNNGGCAIGCDLYHMCVSCSGDLVHAVSNLATSNRTWLIRTNSNGEL